MYHAYSNCDRMCQKQTDEPEVGGSTITEVLAVLYYRQGKLEQAEPLLHRALTDLQPELDMYIRAHEPQSGFFSEVIECLNTLALLYQDQGKHEMDSLSMKGETRWQTRAQA
jgi:hypothetical protein